MNKLTNNEELIQLRGIRFTFGGAQSLFEGLDFSLRQGERLALLGGNGVGKTTLLRIIMGLARPDEGTVRLFGQNCRSEKDFAAARTRIGFVFQDADDQLFCPTVAEDVAFGPLNLGLPHDLVHERVHAALAEVGLAGFEQRISYHLSGGEKKLVALATVLAMKPELLLLDEPTAGLAADAAERIAHLLRASGLPCLIVSHDRDFLAQSAVHAQYLQAGRIRDPLTETFQG
ncbi:MAG: energy-coupling factor ABC transporter ATP-binding protein [Deltaproteobacteria bacterium]|jgi:cobalt/nickel transport system ATP-binding protein|nr:energy-coupling factor ABC transporter ATP-binding protein [Deltaproteobacteria bacterium]